MKYIIFFIVLFLQLPALASELLTLSKFEKSEFSPVHGGVFDISFKLQKKANVSIQIFSPDGDLVREIKSQKILKKGANKLSWDGKDLNGIIVADEAYLPVFYAVDENGNQFKVDNRKTGGEVLENLNVIITPDKNISFKLPFPSRVLSRTGIKGGAMLKTLANWEPKNKGKVTIRWDGFDQDGLQDIRKHKDLSVLVRAYRLPDYSIISSGNKKINYLEYRKSIQHPDWKPIKRNDFILERNGKRIDRHYYMPKNMNLSPLVLVEFQNNYPKDKQGRAIINCPCPIKVDLKKAEIPQLQESLYEIAFFIDDQFVSEQEQGYVPFTWRWTPSGLKPGEHMLTVNVSGLRGEVGVKSLLFIAK